MADAKALRPPASIPRTPERYGFGSFGFKGDGSLRTLGLGVGVATANTQVNYEVIPFFGSVQVTVRLKCSNTGTLDLFGLGPDFNPQQGSADNTAYGSLAGTIYTTNNPSQVAVTANTEVSITSTSSQQGLGYLIIKFTGTAAGTITYCDVCWHFQSL